MANLKKKLGATRRFSIRIKSTYTLNNPNASKEYYSNIEGDLEIVIYI